MSCEVAVLSLLALNLLGAVRIQGDVVCPCPADVAMALTEFLSPSERRNDVATLSVTAGTLEVELRDERGTLVSRKVLDVGPRCEDLARAVAVLIAAWEAEVPTAASLPPLPSEPPLVVARAVVPREHRTLAYEVGAGAVSSWAPSLSVGGLVYGTWGPWERTRLLADLSATAARSLHLPPGVVDWQRFVLGVGGSYLLFERGLSLRAEGDLLASLLRLQGAGFTENGVAWEVDPGARLGLRASWPLGSWRGWVQVSGTGWLWDERAEVAGVGSLSLPRLEATLGVGVAYARP